MAYVLYINAVKIAFTERKVIDTVEDIGLARTIVADKAIDLLREMERGFRAILEIVQYELLQVH
jgi:hypothetical protein